MVNTELHGQDAQPVESHSGSKIVRLDVLRGLAILVVLFYHYYLYVFGQDQLRWNGNWRDINSAPNDLFLVLYPLAFGWMGVSLFFVISGFVIHWSYLRAKDASHVHFYWKRFWRIFPAYLVVMFGIVLGTSLIFSKHYSSSQILTHAFMVHNLQRATFYGINPSFWSLAIEVQFYLMFPLVLIMRKRIGIGGVLAVAFMLSCALRFADLYAFDWQQPPVHVWFSTLILWPDWLLGAVLAERYHRNLKPVFSLPMVFLLGLLFVVAHFIRPLSMFGFALASLFSAALIDVVIRSDRHIGRTESLVLIVGLWSYSLYLIHQPLIEYLNRGLCKVTNNINGVDCRVTNSFFVIPVILGLSWLLYRLVERPAQRIGRVIWSRHAASKPLPALQLTKETAPMVTHNEEEGRDRGIYEHADDG